MINKNCVRISRVSVYTFSLDIVEFKNFITILSRDDTCNTNNILGEWLSSLDSLEIISLVHWVVIHITQERWIVFKTNVPSQEWVVERVLLDCTL